MINFPIELWRFMDNKQMARNGELMDKYMEASNAGCHELAGHIKRELDAHRAQCYREFRAKVVAFEPSTD